MTDPLATATLGGLAYDAAKAVMAKLVDARIASGIKTTLRERPLKKGWTAEDQQAAPTSPASLPPGGGHVK